MSTYREIPASQVEDLVQNGAVLIDVRESDEVAVAILPAARHIPLGEIPHHIGELDRTATIALICRSGGRSGRAAEFLVAQGFTDVINLTGGMMELGLAE